jgi:hypothetical protein
MAFGVFDLYNQETNTFLTLLKRCLSLTKKDDPVWRRSPCWKFLGLDRVRLFTPVPIWKRQKRD